MSIQSKLLNKPFLAAALTRTLKRLKASSTSFGVYSGLISSAISIISATHARADMSDADYQAALELAQQKVMRQKSLNPHSVNALSSALIRNPLLSSSLQGVEKLNGRTYRVGDHWEVAAWTFDNTMARMTTDPEHLAAKGGNGGVFRYEVIQAQDSPASPVVIQVTQLEEFGIKKVDTRVKKLRLTVNERMAQNRKTYEIEDSQGKAHSISVSPDGIHSAITRLELFPLDIPDLTAVEAGSVSTFPALPEGLQAVATQAGYHPDASRSSVFEQDDFFGRAIQIFWQSGDPWPSYFKTSNGVAILIRKGTSS